MGLRFRPVDTAFYDLFTEQAQHLVTGAGLLAEMLAETSDKADVAARMRAAAICACSTVSRFTEPWLADRNRAFHIAASIAPR